MLCWLIGRPLALPDAVLARHPELAHARWRLGGLPPRLGGWGLGQRSVAGIALGGTIFMAPSARLEPFLLLHELAHVHQFERYSVFTLRYLWESVRRGYHGNRFEHAADQYAAVQLSRPPSGV